MAIRVSDPKPSHRPAAPVLPAVAGLLKDALDGLRRLYGERFAGAYLFGSQARGEAEPDSDIDILVVLQQLEGHMAEIERTSFLCADLSIRAGTTVSFVFVTAADWATADTPFLNTVRPDAIPL
jgi:predicted nucleotidyltransferase